MLALLMFHETRGGNPKKYFKVLSCVIYTIIENYVCIDYLACQSKIKSSFCGYYFCGEIFYQNIGYWNSIFVNELIVVS